MSFASMVNNKKVSALVANVGKAVVGKKGAAELVVTALLCRGHILIEDVPGVGKTSLVLAIARSLGLNFRRIQFTPDVMPSDLTGYTMYDLNEKRYVYHPGLLAADFVLADEINRASPKTQSALLEAMEERQVTVDGRSYPLSPSFLIAATENPVDLQGTYPLPEAQLDRFFLKIRLGYPEIADETAILKMHMQKESVVAARPQVITAEELAAMQADVLNVACNDKILHYIAELAAATRASRDLALGLSPRGAIALMRAAQASAYLEDRTFVTPDDVRKMTPFVVNHRLVLKKEAIIAGKSAGAIMSTIAMSASIPTLDIS